MFANPYDISTSQLIVSFILLLIIATLTALYAQKVGRNPLGWFILAILFSFLAPLVLLLLPAVKDESEIETKSQRPAPTPPPTENLQFQEQTRILQEDTLWFYLDEKRKQYGPISLIGIKDLWDKGQITLNTYVWTDGMKEWQKVEQLPVLYQKLVSMKKLL